MGPSIVEKVFYCGGGIPNMEVKVDLFIEELEIFLD